MHILYVFCSVFHLSSKVFHLRLSISPNFFQVHILFHFMFRYVFHFTFNYIFFVYVQLCVPYCVSCWIQLYVPLCLHCIFLPVTLSFMGICILRYIQLIHKYLPGNLSCPLNALNVLEFCCDYIRLYLRGNRVSLNGEFYIFLS